MKRLFQLAVERGQLEENPFRYVRKPKTAQRAIHIFSDDECARMVQAAQQTKIGVPFRWDIFILAAHASFETTRRFYLAIRSDLLDRARKASSLALKSVIVAKALHVNAKNSNKRA